MKNILFCVQELKRYLLISVTFLCWQFR